MNIEATQIDWIEAKTTELLARAKRSRWFEGIISDAKWFAAEGYEWDVALSMSMKYWLS